jgi:2-polyprenyl-3-methyl-5-hydroxy-6-metoxy-1,4-benzoquinol methylase
MPRRVSGMSGILRDMAGCCDGYDDLFGARYSGHRARRYRKHGLDRTAARIVAFLAGQGVGGASVLEIGGGVGDLQIELLRRGAAHATNLELVDSYESDAADLAADAGAADRVTRLQLDLARRPEAVEPHDIVVLHRVVCCYPDHQRLLAAAADHARRTLVFSYPPRNVVSRTLTGAENLAFRFRRIAFRTYLHDPAAMVAAAQRGGLTERYKHKGLGWHVLGLAAGD